MKMVRHHYKFMKEIFVLLSVMQQHFQEKASPFSLTGITFASETRKQ